MEWVRAKLAAGQMTVLMNMREFISRRQSTGLICTDQSNSDCEVAIAQTVTVSGFHYHSRCECTQRQTNRHWNKDIGDQVPKTFVAP